MTLQRRTPLKRTELKRGNSQLKRTGKLNQVSTKRKKENVERRTLTELTFADDPYCKLGPAFVNVWANYQGCRVIGDALHELQKRSAAGSITDPENCLLACNPCNSAVENFPAVAWRCGLVLRAGDTYEDLERRRIDPEPYSAWLERKGIG